jgi:hypothetical protein
MRAYRLVKGNVSITYVVHGNEFERAQTVEIRREVGPTVQATTGSAVAARKHYAAQLAAGFKREAN